MTKDKWIQGAVDPKKKGALHKELGVPQGKKIPEKKLKEAEKKGGTLARQAHFAENVKYLNKKKG